MNIHAQAVAAGVGEPSTYEENMVIYDRLVHGDETAEREMVERNMALVVSKVDQFIDAMPQIEFLREDLIGEGFLALTEAVRQMKTRGPVADPKPTGYICSAIQNTIGELVDEELHLQAPSRTVRHRRKIGDPVSTPPQVAVEPMHLDEIQDPMGMTDLRDLIDACCECEDERVIVRMREQGHSDREIAAAINLPHSATYVMRRDLYKRFLAKSGMKGEV